MTAPIDRSQRIAALQAARDAIDREIALLAGQAAPPDAASTSAEPDWISLEQAAAIRGVARDTMARHAKRFGLGTFTGRRWRIDRNRVRALNEGRPYLPLEKFPDAQTRRLSASNSAKPDDSPHAPAGPSARHCAP